MMTLEELLVREGFDESPDELLAWAARRARELVADLDPGSELAALLRGEELTDPPRPAPATARPQGSATRPPPLPTPAPLGMSKPSTLSMNDLARAEAREVSDQQHGIDQTEDLAREDVELLDEDDVELMEEVSDDDVDASADDTPEWQAALVSAQTGDDSGLLQLPTGVSLAESPANESKPKDRGKERAESSS